MAITTETFKVNAGWARSDIISQMESAFSYLGWNGGYQTGHIVGLGSFWGGGDTNASDDYYDVFQKSTSGIGTGASFYVYRDTHGVRRIIVNRPGVGYTSGELITIDADSIGGLSNGATDLSFKVCVEENVTNTATYGIAVTTVTNSAYAFIGTDRNGVVGGGQSVITVREGDSLEVTNSWSSSYNIAIKNAHPFVVNEATDVNRGQLAGQDTFLSINETMTFRTKIGQAGTYYWSTTSQNNLYGSEAGRLIIEPWTGDPADRSLVGVGTTAAFWDKNLANTYPWGVAKRTVQSNKRFGDTYTLFCAQDNTNIDIVTGSGWSQYKGTEYYGDALNNNTDTSDYHGGTAEKNRFAGANYLDFGSYSLGDIRSPQHDVDEYASNYTTIYNRLARLSHGSNTGYDLDLNVFRSGLDPNFAVFSYRNPTLSSTHVASNTHATWFFHHFTTSIWDLDYLYLGGLTQVLYDGSTTDPKLVFRTYLASEDPDNSGGQAKRSAEFGYSSYRGYTTTEQNYIDYTIESATYEHDLATTSAVIYYRSNDNPLRYSGGSNDITGKDRVSPEANFNAAIKGLPMNGNLIPVPYYIPDDFALINFYYNAANANIQQGDTITISPSEVYKVICGSYNQTTVTRGILFCARVV